MARTRSDASSRASPRETQAGRTLTLLASGSAALVAQVCSGTRRMPPTGELDHDIRSGANTDEGVRAHGLQPPAAQCFARRRRQPACSR